jgi:hypothetical protein
MRPAIEPGESLAIQPAARVRVGDVVAFLAPDGSIQAHRLVRIEGNRLWTRGDASPHRDPPIDREQVVGLVARGGSAGVAIARWPRLAPLLGALGRVRDRASLAGAGRALIEAAAISIIRR